MNCTKPASPLSRVSEQNPGLISGHHLFQLGEWAKIERDLVVDADQRFKQIQADLDKAAKS
jgi:hypothetical protein